MSEAATDPRLAAAYAHCESLLREGDRDRWLSCLFAPASARPHLHAIYAFSLDVARVRDVVSDAMPGEIRYQWWRDVFEGEGRGDVAAHPIAAAALDTIGRFRLPRNAFSNLVDARTFDLYDDPMPGLRQFEGYCGETSSALLRLATLILGGGRDPGGAEAAGHAGVAYAIAGLLRALPWHAARGQCYLPLDVLARHGVSRDNILQREASAGLREALAEMRSMARARLAAARPDIRALPAPVAAAFLPVALVEPWLRLMDRRDYDPFQSRIDIPQWRRQWILWRAARRSAA